MRRKLYTAILLLFIAGATAAGCSATKAYEKPLTPVRVQAVQTFIPSGAEGNGVRYSATIRSASQLDLAFKTGGYVSDLLQVRGADRRLRSVQEGDYVAKGTVLARLRQEDFAPQMNGAQAQVAEAQSALKTGQAQQAEAEAAARQAQRDLERATALLESDSLTRPEHDQARTKCEMAQAKVAAARAHVQVIQAKINHAQAGLSQVQLAQRDAVLRAPFSGLVLRRAVEPGSLIAPGAPIITLAEASSVKAVFGVPDLTVSSLQLGTELVLNTEALPGQDFRGLITRIAAAADPRTRIFEVEVTIPRPPTELRAGMVASLTVPDPHASATPVIAAPLGAIVRAGDVADTYAVNVIVHENGHDLARRRTVKLGEAYGNLIGITEGLQAGEQVIVAGASAVADGERVRIMQ